jgi:RNA polymerase subunit RPABC4/transcription elongation factor Spt4
MPSLLNNMIDFAGSSAFGTFQIAAIAYLGFLWLSIIIWVTRDSISRSNSLIFQTFSILINIIVPILGVLLYLIIRPGKTNMDRYYEEIERHMILENGEEKGGICEKCLIPVDKDYTFCPNCGTKAKKVCNKCKKHFPGIWGICPYCGAEQEDEADDKVKNKKIKK